MGAKLERKENELLREILGAIHHLKKESERIMSVLSDIQAAVAAVQTAGATSTSAVLAAIADINSLPASDAQLVPLTTALTAVAVQMQKDAASLLAAIAGTSTPPGVSPTLTAIGAVSAPLAGGGVTVPLSGITSTTPSPSIAVVAVASDGGAVISTPSVFYTSPAATGSLMFTPVAAGTSTVTVTVNDGVGSAVQTFTVTVS